MAMTCGRNTRAIARSATSGLARDRMVRPSVSARLGPVRAGHDLALAGRRAHSRPVMCSSISVWASN